MIKKRFVLLAAAAVLAAAIFIPPVRAAAESVLSIFRVADVKTIRISVQDLKDMAVRLEQEGAAAFEDGEARQILTQLLEKVESEVRPLSDVREFTAFPFSLPAALKDETPVLYAVSSQAQSIVLDTAKINAALLELGASVLLDGSMNGTAVTVSTPPAVMAKYDGVVLAATQTIYIDAPEDVLNSLWKSFLSIPAISDGLRAQLAAISPKTRDVYLPVIEGLGRETGLKGTTGYVYASGDLARVMEMMSGLAGRTPPQELRDENASVLIWLKNGVLYFLAGEKSDSELSQIARSIA